MLVKNLFRYWTFQVFSPGTVLREKYEAFKELLEQDKTAHEYMAELEDIYYKRRKVDFQAVVRTYERYSASVGGMVEALLKMSPARYWSLKDYYKKFDFYIRFMLARPDVDFSPPFILDFSRIASSDEATCGMKALSLSRLCDALTLPVPDGFVITTNAFHYFIEANDLRGPIDECLAEVDIHDPASCESAGRDIRKIIMDAPLPEEIELEIHAAMDRYESRGSEGTGFALRSSAVGEDGSLSFAGQYLTLLDIEKADIPDGYKKIIAGKYAPEAIYYRISHGLCDHETPMAVLALEMIDARSAGVIYTRDTRNPDNDTLVITSIWGQGAALVDGQTAGDVIVVSRTPPGKVVDVRAATGKTSVEESEQAVQEEKTESSGLSLDEAAIVTLSEWADSIETHSGQPQDIEWCQDRSGRLFILQSRPLHLDAAEITDPDGTENQDDPDDTDRESDDWTPQSSPLCSGAQTIFPGVAAGRICCLEKIKDPSEIPEGSVLVVRYALPRLVTHIHRAAAIVVETGSTASHFASVAREFGIPAVVNVENGFETLEPGEEVVVDASRGAVYKGRAEDLPARLQSGSGKNRQDTAFLNSSFTKKLEYLLSFAAELKLTDPGSDSFTPEGCRSLHDIIRFAHEIAMQEMFFIGSRKGARKKGARKLVSQIPMLFYILDVGSGLTSEAKNQDAVSLDDVKSIPLQAVFKGLTNPGICWSETTHFDWEEYDKVVMAGGIISADSPQFGSYAVVAGEYMNVNFRFGYHFVIVDAICSSSQQDNYIMFRFSGGGGTREGRTLRAEFIRQVLKRIGFMVDIRSDLIDARCEKGTRGETQEALESVGLLLGATKIMDIYIKDDADINGMVSAFFNGQYDFRSLPDPDR